MNKVEVQYKVFMYSSDSSKPNGRSPNMNLIIYAFTTVSKSSKVFNTIFSTRHITQYLAQDIKNR